MIFLFDKEIETCKELVEAVLDNITIDDVADEYGCITRTIDKDWIHDNYEYLFEDEEYEEFNRILYGSDDYNEDIELDFSDPWQEARDFYYSTRGC